MSEIFAVQLTAVATLALAVFAVVTAVLAFLAWRKQAKEVSDQAIMLEVQSGQLEEQRKINARQTEVLELQARELQQSLAERKRDAERRHREQASFVFISERKYKVSGGSGGAEPIVNAKVVNKSILPVYDAELHWTQGPEGNGEPNPEPLGTIMPGYDCDGSHTFQVGARVESCGAALRFTDAAGTRWLRRADGYLNEYLRPAAPAAETPAVDGVGDKATRPADD